MMLRQARPWPSQTSRENPNPLHSFSKPLQVFPDDNSARIASGTHPRKQLLIARAHPNDVIQNEQLWLNARGQLPKLHIRSMVLATIAWPVVTQSKPRESGCLLRAPL